MELPHPAVQVEHLDQRIAENIFAMPGVRDSGALRPFDIDPTCSTPHLRARADYALSHA
jgi:hypothetical protein